MLPSFNTVQAWMGTLSATGEWVPFSAGASLPFTPAPITYVAAGTTTITAGGSSQTVFAAGTIVTGAWITNPSVATENLFVNVAGGTASTTEGGANFVLFPGQTLAVGPATNAITITGATTGHAFSAARF